ncbi:hypothetical protein WSM22_40990 [Cytophagales bacterium WSM2-2]|nr:hypothetical protein WSM22_40990 [Cytophagales bacterium WSM2-2]
MPWFLVAGSTCLLATLFITVIINFNLGQEAYKMLMMKIIIFRSRKSLVEGSSRYLFSSMRKVLVVEDDPSMRWLLKNLLRNKYEVVAKNNGMEAFSWLSVRNIPDVIISDIRMPVMDGVELLENLSISGLYKNIPVIVLTGFDETATLRRCMDLGAYAFLVKPFKPQDLLEKIERPFAVNMFQ